MFFCNFAMSNYKVIYISRSQLVCNFQEASFSKI